MVGKRVFPTRPILEDVWAVPGKSSNLTPEQWQAARNAIAGSVAWENAQRTTSGEEA